MSHVTRKHVLDRGRKVYGRTLDIVDAKVPLRVQPKPCDAKSANPLSPDTCVLARCASRQHDAKAACVYKESAYFDLVCEDGEVRFVRFVTPASTLRAITAFDRGKRFPVGRALIFLPPPPHRQLEAIRKQKRAWRRSSAGKAFYAVGAAQQAVRRAQVQAERARDTYREARLSHPATSTKLDSVRSTLDASRKKLAATRERLQQAEHRASKVKNARGLDDKRRPKPRRFDLTTRNGAIGNYHFAG